VCGLSTSDALLIAGRPLQGVGGAVMLPAALSIVMNMFEEGAERNKALGIWGGLGATAGTTGLIAGGLLTRYVGWQSIFLVNVPIGALALAFAPRMVPDLRLEVARRRFDVLGAIVGTGGLVLLVDAVSQAPRDGWGATRTIVVLAASADLLLAFLLIEDRASSPLLPLPIFRLPTVAGANAAGLLLGGSFFAFVFVGTLYMQDVLHYSALQTGAALQVWRNTRAGLASGLLNTSQQLGGALGVAIASSVAGSHTSALLHAGHAMPTALTGGYQRAFWVLGAIALLALPAIFTLLRRGGQAHAMVKTTVEEAQPALAGTH
jgi:Major Facilitator Superfamily